MNKRRKTLLIFGLCYFIFAISLFFFLRRVQKNFTPEKLDLLMNTVSEKRDKTDDLCKYAIRGDPEGVGKKYVKVNFWCTASRNAKSTLSLEAFTNKSVKGVLSEYARIMGFEYKTLEEKKWICMLNDQLITDYSTETVDAATIDCFENESVLKDVKKNI